MTLASNIHIGTSGWTYDDWQGRFYPEDVTGTDRLEYYARHFDTVELNASFYRVPTEPMVASWNRRLPPDFHMVVKGSQLITHRRKLVNVEESLEFFLSRIRPLQILKVILWQLPPSLHKDVPRLEDFLTRLPTWTRHAVEFRHASWWDDQVAETLARYSAAFAAISMGGLPDTIFPTTDFLYLRFHGPAEQIYQYDYPDKELVAWVERVTPHLPGRTLYAFFNNDVHANAPKNAVTLRNFFTATNTPTD